MKMKTQYTITYELQRKECSEGNLDINVHIKTEINMSDP